MKVKWTLLLLSLFFYSIQAVISAEKIYRWVDENGKVHYGDKPKENSSASVFSKKELQSIETKKTKTKPIQLYPLNRQTQVNSNNHNNKANKCKKMKARVHRLENQLRKRLSPSYFEGIKDKLEELKARRRKEC